LKEITMVGNAERCGYEIGARWSAALVDRHARDVPQHVCWRPKLISGKLFPVQGTIMTFPKIAVTSTEASAVLGLAEVRVRKEIEYGLIRASSPPRLSFQELVYLRVLALLDLELSIADRQKLHDRITAALSKERLPESVMVGRLLELRLKPLVREVRLRVGAFMRWRDERVVADSAVLGGEPVFRGSRLSVRHIGGMAERGEHVGNILEDYPYLSRRDVEFARVFVRAYPRLGRPRESAEAAPR
jgi:uncharacterized protein (DUF433 family)